MAKNEGSTYKKRVCREFMTHPLSLLESIYYKAVWLHLYIQYITVCLSI